MAKSDDYKREAERLADQLARLRSTYQRAIRDYQSSSGGAAERHARHIIDIEGEMRSIQSRYDRADENRKRALWDELKR